MYINNSKTGIVLKCANPLLYDHILSGKVVSTLVLILLPSMKNLEQYFIPGLNKYFLAVVLFVWEETATEKKILHQLGGCESIMRFHFTAPELQQQGANSAITIETELSQCKLLNFM